MPISAQTATRILHAEFVIERALTGFYRTAVQRGCGGETLQSLDNASEANE
jgi:hypothetical protein